MVSSSSRILNFQRSSPKFFFSTVNNLSDINHKSISIEQMYQRKTPVEHVLLRPGMYIGSVESTRELLWLYKGTKKENTVMAMMSKEMVEYVPALYKIFDEILVNAVDNKVRDTSMTKLHVDIDTGSAENQWQSTISIYNNGKGIPIQLHPTENVYVPELILGHLLTGSNFDDTNSRLTGGRHGYGAKLTNIFSKEFTVETGDEKTGRLYRQTWKKNMQVRGDPEISDLPIGMESFTRITFSPDLDKFDMKKINKGMLHVLQKRVFDVAGCLSNVDVRLDGNQLPISGFQAYVCCFRDALMNIQPSIMKPQSASHIENTVPPVLYTRVNSRWEIGVLPSDTGFTQISFVNGMSTLRGGTHVQYISDQLCRRIADYINRKHVELNVTAANVKSHLSIFINCLIENPAFDSQMKEYLSSKPPTFGSQCILSERFSKQVIASSGIVDRVVDWAQSKQRKELVNKVSTKRKNIVNIPKLEDANLAGGVNSHKCTLILTEGDSAKALAVAGLAVVKRDQYGVFPLRGKFLNVRDATLTQLSASKELANLCTILGLQFDQSYKTSEDRKKLRYGRIMLMTDQDHDGSHIKGLVLNMLHHFWPELLKTDFVSEFITPIIKVNRKRSSSSSTNDKSSSTSFEFFSIPEYHEWRQKLGTDANGSSISQWNVKYYKGLGTSTSSEGREYFRKLDKHNVDFEWMNEKDDDSIQLAFSKAKTDERKQWLLHEFDPKAFLDVTKGKVTYQDFVNKELIQFSHADTLRSIPSVIDGLKPSQRKVLFAAMKRKLTKEIKVAQLAGYCSEHTGYQHGEVSLHSTIINMAQDYVGGNNIPLLYPSGQFGTRLQGGKDAASARYIYTKLGPLTRILFNEEDDKLLTYKDDDGLSVEPEYYVPIVPLLLVNGSDGIGTGWSTSIPRHNPIDVIDHLLSSLSDEQEQQQPLPPLLPWSKGFKGTITASQTPTKYTTVGVVNLLKSNTVEVTELPVGRWVDDFKNGLLKLIGLNKVRSFSEYHTEKDVRFVIKLPAKSKKNKEELTEASIIDLLKLQGSISLSNMHAFSAETGRIEKYASSTEILEAFYPIRLALYERRRSYLIKKYGKELNKLDNRMAFVSDILSGKLSITTTDDARVRTMSARPKAELVMELQERGFAPASAFRMSEEEEGCDMNKVHKYTEEDYQYLLGTSILSFTAEHIQNLKKDHEQKAKALDDLVSTSAKAMWRSELLILREKLLKDKDFERNRQQTRV